MNEPTVTYGVKGDTKGIRFCQYAKDPLPPWAVDVQPEPPKESFQSEIRNAIARASDSLNSQYWWDGNYADDAGATPGSRLVDEILAIAKKYASDL
jgi:hypothetical protein